MQIRNLKKILVGKQKDRLMSERITGLCWVRKV